MTFLRERPSLALCSSCRAHPSARVRKKNTLKGRLFTSQAVQAFPCPPLITAASSPGQRQGWRFDPGFGSLLWR